MPSIAWGALIGDTAHIISLVNVITFAVAVRYYRDDPLWKDQGFDPLWKDQGFCVMNPEVPYGSSHDLCLYADTFLAAVSYVVYLILRNEKGMKPANDLVKSNILGVFGHGIGHGAIAAGLRKEMVEAATTNITNTTATATDVVSLTLWETLEFNSVLETLQQWAPLMIFWFFMIRAAMPKGSNSAVACVALASAVGQLGFPLHFGFTYVQSVLFIVFDFNEIWNKDREEKGFEHALYPILVGIPVGIIGWIESTLCSKGYILVGGHLIYDAYIPLSMLFFYMICWVRATIQNPTVSRRAPAKKTKVA